MKESWQVAELLEEIANNADPIAIMRQRTRKIAANLATGPMPGMMIAPDEVAGTVAVTFFIPVEKMMDGVDGTAEDVLEWLQTGLQPGQSVKLQRMDGLMFAITQTHTGPMVVEDFRELATKYGEAIQKRANEQRRRAGLPPLPWPLSPTH